jgi:hypothetical protein
VGVAHDQQCRQQDVVGKVTLPVTFGTKDKYRTENVTFDMADIPFTMVSWASRRWLSS